MATSNTLTLRWVRDTKNFSVYEQIDGINKLYLPQGFGNNAKALRVEIAPVSLHQEGQRDQDSR